MHNIKVQNAKCKMQTQMRMQMRIPMQQLQMRIPMQLQIPTPLAPPFFLSARPSQRHLSCCFALAALRCNHNHNQPQASDVLEIHSDKSNVTVDLEVTNCAVRFGDKAFTDFQFPTPFASDGRILEMLASVAGSLANGNGNLNHSVVLSFDLCINTTNFNPHKGKV